MYNCTGAHGTSDSVDAFEVYEIGSGGPPKLILEADPKQFGGQSRATGTYTFSIEGLPKKVVSCLIYRIPKSRRREAVLQFFNFGQPENEFASFPSVEAAPTKTVLASGSEGCASLVSANSEVRS
jgi:hypothetical protein